MPMPYRNKNKSSYLLRKVKMVIIMFKNKLIVAPVILAAICLTGCGTTNNETYSNTSVPAIVYETSTTTTSTTTTSTTETSTTETSTTETSSSKPVSSSSTTVESKPVESTSDTTSDSDDVSTFDISKLQINIDSSKPESSKPESSKPESSKPDVDINAADMASASSISKICGLKSEVELKIESCIVDVFNDHNPYDVEYNYGKAYDKYVDACNWSLVFDADYYMSEFPLLAMQYNYDKKLLLEHFQTVGIHEGRQGNKSFNVGAYKSNCASNIRNTFGDNYEGYYFYYMLNYATEKSVRTTGGSATQYKTIMTALQAAELEGINGYRDEVDVSDVKFVSELAAFSNFRAYTNTHDYYDAHDWNKKNRPTLDKLIFAFGATSFSENICRSNTQYSFGRTHFTCYRDSSSHYKTMVNAAHDLVGCSNSYRRSDVAWQCDIYLNL